MTTGSMATGHAGHTATLLDDGRVLVPNGNDTEAAELYDPDNGAWTATEAIPGGRVHHTTTLLPDGKVLVAGGSDSRVGLPSASSVLFDPGTGRWTQTGSMTGARAGHTATLLPDGRVLVAGGVLDPDGMLVLATAELYDPDTGTWAGSGNLAQARAAHTATLLPEGGVLVTGGVGKFVRPTDSLSLVSVELFDPESGTWTTVASIAEARFDHTATLLPDGRVLVAGGSPGFGKLLASAELYDASRAAWIGATAMSTGRSEHTATLLADGTVLVTGGQGMEIPTASAERFDPRDDAWTTAVPPVVRRLGHTATALEDGRVLVAGGTDGSDSLVSTELYDPGTGS
jgi:N-acetylneuraminic acid mutarotase